MKIDYQNLEKKIKVHFKNKDLLIKSLTHKSFNKENNNEKINPAIVLFGLILGNNFLPFIILPNI